MNAIKSFSEFGIKARIEHYQGDKIKIEKILNQEITVLKFKIGPSKYDGERLDLQIVFKGENRVLWTPAKYLIQTIQQIKPEDFPFTTKIVKIDEHLEFT